MRSDEIPTESVTFHMFSYCEQFDNMDLEREMSVCVFDVLTNFHSVTSLNFKLKNEQDTAVECLLLNQDVLTVLPNRNGIWQMFVTHVPVTLSN